MKRNGFYCLLNFVMLVVAPPQFGVGLMLELSDFNQREVWVLFYAEFMLDVFESIQRLKLVG
ncbi:hypothetical protein UE98_19275 [Burkholderia cenocepacia]|nr:hypothetical protein UE98_19275 [Burkholderia cenocepacia]